MSQVQSLSNNRLLHVTGTGIYLHNSEQEITVIYIYIYFKMLTWSHDVYML